MTQPFTVLVVCTGNICRSPMAERLLRQALRTRIPGQAHQLRVHSAGTYAGHRGEPMQPGARAVLAERGVISGGFRATALSAPMIEEADLILTAERSHRTSVVRLVPAALARSFTLREFGRLLDGAASDPELIDPELSAPRERAHALVRHAAAQRGSTAPLLDAALDDIDDPYAQPVEAFRRTAAEIDDALAGWVALLATASSR